MHILLLKDGGLPGSRTGVGAGGQTASPVDARTMHPPVEILPAVTAPLNDGPAPAIGHVTECQEGLSVCSGPDAVVATRGALPAIHCRAIWAEQYLSVKWAGGKAKGCVPPGGDVTERLYGTRTLGQPVHSSASPVKSKEMVQQCSSYTSLQTASLTKSFKA